MSHTRRNRRVVPRRPAPSYGSLALQRAFGKDIVTSPFSFAPADLANSAGRHLHLDPEQQITASGGLAYGRCGKGLSADILIGSGLRCDRALPDGSSIPNGAHRPDRRQANFGARHAIEARRCRPSTASP